MITDCVADLHGFYPELEGGDLLIVAGDLTTKDDKEGYNAFSLWSEDQAKKYRKIIFIAGNHDSLLKNKTKWPMSWPNNYGDLEYLEDSYALFDGLKIWGSPWTKTFDGMNPNCKAFTVDTEEELEEKWALIPDDIDILITHCPPYNILDEVESQEHCTSFYAGSPSLLKRVCEIKPKLHVFGHIHEGYGKLFLKFTGPNTWAVNASHVNEHYEPVNNPIRVIL